MTAVAPTQRRQGRLSGQTRSKQAAPAGPKAWLNEFLASPLADYHLVLTASLWMVGLGVVMVLSSSSIYAESVVGAGPYYFVIRQLLFLALGLFPAWLISRCSPAALRPLSWIAMIGVLALLGLTLVLGSDAGKGNQAWLEIGPISLQPSEFAKPVIICWAASIWETKRHNLQRVGDLLMPVSLGFGLVLALVVLQHDLGTAMILGLIMLAMLFFVGANWRLITAVILAGVAGVAALVVASPNRMNRIFSFLGREAAVGTNDQRDSAIYALATGGWFGVGLGASRQKYGSLADAAHNDFIFAVIGEELGLVGTVLVIGLFMLFAFSGFRIALRSTTVFDRVVSASITAWIVGQAIVNMLVATGMAPVMGIPLPFLSYGGSSLLACLAGVGLLLGCARREPDAAAALAARGKRPQMSAVVAARR